MTYDTDMQDLQKCNVCVTVLGGREKALQFNEICVIMKTMRTMYIRERETVASHEQSNRIGLKNLRDWIAVTKL